MHAVVRHGIRSFLGLHHRHDGIHIWDIHRQSNPVGSFRVGEGAYVRYTERPEDFLALGRREPMLDIIYVVMDKYVRHLSSGLQAIATAAGVADAGRT
jgi:hypothetical protein